MGKTVKVRIAVCVDEDGSWMAHGAKGYCDAESMNGAMCEPGDALSWVTAEVRVPEPEECPEVAGTVEEDTEVPGLAVSDG